MQYVRCFNQQTHSSLLYLLVYVAAAAECFGKQIQQGEVADLGIGLELAVLPARGTIYNFVQTRTNQLLRSQRHSRSLRSLLDVQCKNLLKVCLQHI